MLPARYDDDDEGEIINGSGESGRPQVLETYVSSDIFSLSIQIVYFLLFSFTLNSLHRILRGNVGDE